MMEMLNLPERAESTTVKSAYGYLVPSILFILVFAIAARTPLDSDLWWHLRAGEETIRNGSPYLTDTLSYTRFGEAWINHSWLAQVLFFGLYQLGSLRAISAGTAILAAASIFIVYPQIQAPALLRAFTLVLSSAVASMVWSPRPQIFSLLFLGFTSYVIFEFQHKKKDRLWLLLPGFILWSNLHGGYVLGFIYIGILVAGQLIDLALGLEDEDSLTGKKLLKLVLWSAASGACVAVNPNGAAMWLIPFRTVGVGVLQQFISEWASPDFHQPVQQTFLWLLFLTFGAMGFSGLKPRSTEWLLVGGFAYLAFLARRNFGPFALVCAPILGRHLWAALKRYSSRIWVVLPGSKSLQKYLARYRYVNRSRPNHVLNLLVIGVLASTALLKWWAVTDSDFMAEAQKEVFPVGAADWINSNEPPNQLFNDYDWGGYLGWTARDYPIFVDGRTDLYHDEVLREYISVVNAEEGWDEILSTYQVNTIIIKTGSPLSREILKRTDWWLAYQDELADIFIRTAKGR